MLGYQIKTDRFEGPFDLLLFFIQRDELDIDDIPISKITNDFLDYIRQLEELNLDVASEFILVAASLMRIKAKMLIPRKEVDASGNEIDPRYDLAQSLHEYKKFKEVIDDFHHLEETRWEKFFRGNVASELKSIASKALIDIELESLSLYKLMQTFNKLIAQFDENNNKPVHQIIKYEYSIEGQQQYIFRSVKKGAKVKFETLFLSLENRIEAVITFISLLELLNLQKVSIIQGEGVNNFWIEGIIDQSTSS